MSECTKEQLNCKHHYFKGSLNFHCDNCGVHVVDLIDCLYKQVAELTAERDKAEKAWAADVRELTARAEKAEKALREISYHLSFNTYQAMIKAEEICNEALAGEGKA